MLPTDVPNPHPQMPPGGGVILLALGVALAAAVLVLAIFGLLRLLVRFDELSWRPTPYLTTLSVYLVLAVGAGVLGWYWHESAIQSASTLQGLVALVANAFLVFGLLGGGFAAKMWWDRA